MLAMASVAGQGSFTKMAQNQVRFGIGISHLSATLTVQFITFNISLCRLNHLLLVVW